MFTPTELHSCKVFTRKEQNTMTKNIEKQAAEILKIAESQGVEQNFFFATAFGRYMSQLRYLSQLETLLDTEGVSVERTNTKGITSSTINPALAAHNKTSAEATRTHTSLVSTLAKLKESNPDDESDPLLDFLSGKKPIPK
jgi:hypothetical protein